MEVMNSSPRTVCVFVAMVLDNILENPFLSPARLPLCSFISPGDQQDQIKGHAKNTHVETYTHRITETHTQNPPQKHTYTHKHAHRHLLLYCFASAEQQVHGEFRRGSSQDSLGLVFLPAGSERGRVSGETWCLNRTGRYWFWFSLQ